MFFKMLGERMHGEANEKPIEGVEIKGNINLLGNTKFILHGEPAWSSPCIDGMNRLQLELEVSNDEKDINDELSVEFEELIDPWALIPKELSLNYCELDRFTSSHDYLCRCLAETFAALISQSCKLLIEYKNGAEREKEVYFNLKIGEIELVAEKGLKEVRDFIRRK